ncbi:2-keto-4-pentenoate hydratase [Herbaspirillum sp. SJZ099]|uniref:2-keto-4-pentenoate hydratase n=1 Tax=Herbaspirillum sp. SJZ099 TaxID=2572916 RepID=UPI00119EB359|nr:fumarylacetoacetate hydrolase family protein [Herbaspirillum sp. SJZ099]TWC66582.1 2-keto-4-pentenoate hydratase [Herbaspirillum sp. SJZ099]
MQAHDIARLLRQARESRIPLDYRQVPVDSREQAYAVQDACLDFLGPVGGWKVGHKGAGHEPHCAPLPALGILGDGAAFTLSQWPLCGVEVELALRLRADVGPGELAASGIDIGEIFDAAMPAFEIVETRLAPFPSPNPNAALADLQSHGAIVLGPEIPIESMGRIDFSGLEASLEVGGALVAQAKGGNPMRDLEMVVAWLARHAQRRGMPLQKGQVVMTGSCTGMHFIGSPAAVIGRLGRLNAVMCTFGV